MAIKKTMNKPEIAKFHKLLKAEVSNKEIQSIFKNIDPKTLAKFTPDAIAKAKAAQTKK